MTSNTAALTLLLLASFTCSADAWISTTSSFLTSSRSAGSITSSATSADTDTPFLSSTLSTTRTSTSTSTALYAYDSVDANNDFHFPSDSNSNSNSMVLSKNDLSRLTQMKNRQLTLPLLLVQDSLLPGQTMELASMDGKFHQMVSQLSDGAELCVVGMHPHKAGEPLAVGVSVTIESIQQQQHQQQSRYQSSSGHLLLTVKGKEIVEVQGQPRFDAQQSCFLAKVEVARDDDAILTRQHLTKAATWYDELVPLVQQWETALQEATGNTDNQNDSVDISTVAAATTITSRAYAVAALLNPSSGPPTTSSQAQKMEEEEVSIDIRPALLVACRNEYDRLHLVHTALRTSIQQLTSQARRRQQRRE